MATRRYVCYCPFGGETDVSDVIEMSYTGDILAHRRCPRAWAYGKKAGFHPYEQVQAMEGRLVHHAMDGSREKHAKPTDTLRGLAACTAALLLRNPLGARGKNGVRAPGRRPGPRGEPPLPRGALDPIVRRAIEGVLHTEYELRAVRDVLPDHLGGKSKILLTGIIDLVLQERAPLTYERRWRWTSPSQLAGEVCERDCFSQQRGCRTLGLQGHPRIHEIRRDYVRQLSTYAALYRDRAGEFHRDASFSSSTSLTLHGDFLPSRSLKDCWDAGIALTKAQAAALQASVAVFERNPLDIDR